MKRIVLLALTVMAVSPIDGARSPRERAMEVVAAVSGPFQPAEIEGAWVFSRTFPDFMLGCWPPGAQWEPDYRAASVEGWIALIRVRGLLLDVRLAENYGFLCTTANPQIPHPTMTPGREAAVKWSESDAAT